MIKKFLIAIFSLVISATSSLGNEFIGVIGVAIGDKNNQKN